MPNIFGLFYHKVTGTLFNQEQFKQFDKVKEGPVLHSFSVIHGQRGKLVFNLAH